MKWLTLLFCFGFVLAGASLGINEDPNDLTSTLVTRNRLALLLLKSSKEEVNEKAVRSWAASLRNKQLVKTDNTFESQLMVRDVALAVLEAMTGESFIPNRQGSSTPVKEIIAYRIKDTTWRFHIAQLTDADYERISQNVDYWISGFLQGAHSKKSSHSGDKYMDGHK